jgi:hypothetical protein
VALATLHQHPPAKETTAAMVLQEETAAVAAAAQVLLEEAQSGVMGLMEALDRPLPLVAHL